MVVALHAQLDTLQEQQTLNPHRTEAKPAVVLQQHDEDDGEEAAGYGPTPGRSNIVWGLLQKGVSSQFSVCMPCQ